MTTATTTAPQPYKLSPASRRVFVGLMLGMLVASVSQTIVGPAMPRIVSELGGMDHYSWVATAALLVSAITVPIVGKFSDLYGRRGFYIAGLVVFMVGSLVAGFAQSFWVLVAARAIQGLGMGTVMPLSQTIIGDIIPPRQRGKYQGLMGAVFGVTSVAGPLAGGFITDHWGWRWLFFAGIPIGVVATGFILRFLHLPHERREAKVDSWGIATLAVGLTAVLLATSWGGTSYPWGSATIIGLYVVGVLGLVAFVFAESRAEEPVIPLRLFRSRVFTAANIASFGLAMVMFGSIIYIPVFAQGVLGVDATNSGLILAPLMVGLIVMGILTGLVITRTGVYKPFMAAGVVIMGAGIWLLTRLTFESSQTQLTLAMVVLGIGIGMAMQQYTLVVQNASEKRDLGVATASSQFFRNVGSTVGIAVFGTVLTSGLGGAIASHLPAGAAASMPEGAASAGSVLDPAALSQLPPAVAIAVRQGLADQLHEVFLIGLPIVALVLLATLAIKALPLRDSNHAETPAESAEHAGHELLDTMSQSSAEARTTPAAASETSGTTDAPARREPEPAVR
ncbi:MFS transporter [Phycicoccus jejuensis]|uniref:MDR family MFS transporter n=1 Tax=Phycicoccus jejuensis TaxID=367299 RepID=UPI00384B3D07